MQRLTFEIVSAARQTACPECCGSYEPGLARCSQERGDRGPKLQKRRNQHPSSPFCDYNSRRSADIQEACTTEWRCTQWKVAENTHLCMNQSRQVSRNRPWSIYSRYTHSGKFKMSGKHYREAIITVTYGLISLWKMPLRCMWSIAFSTWYM